MTEHRYRWLTGIDAERWWTARDQRLAGALDWLTSESMRRVRTSATDSAARSIYKDVVAGTIGPATEYKNVVRDLSALTIPRSRTWHQLRAGHDADHQCNWALDCPFGVSVEGHVRFVEPIDHNVVRMQSHLYNFDSEVRVGSDMDTTGTQLVTEAETVSEFGWLAARFITEPVRISADTVLVVNSTSSEVLLRLIWALFVVLSVMKRHKNKDYWMRNGTFAMVKPGGFGIVKFVYMAKEDVDKTSSHGISRDQISSYLSEAMCFISTKIKADIVNLTTNMCLQRVYGDSDDIQRELMMNRIIHNIPMPRVVVPVAKPKHKFKMSSIPRLIKSQSKDFDDMMISGQWVPTQEVFEAFSQDYRGIIAGVIGDRNTKEGAPKVYTGM